MCVRLTYTLELGRLGLYTASYLRTASDVEESITHVVVGWPSEMHRTAFCSRSATCLAESLVARLGRVNGRPTAW